jgi:SET domain-containing protein
MTLYVETILKNSLIHGFGVFAAHDIKKGTIIWKYDPKFDLTVSRAEIDQLPEPCRQQVLKYAYRCGVDNLYIVAVDDSRYMNHSTSPNTAEDFTVDPRGLTVASRDIKAGEELTMDYFEFDLDAAEKLGVSVSKA